MEVALQDLMQTQLVNQVTQNQLLMGILIVNILGLIGLMVMAMVTTKALKQSQARIERLLNEWEPRLIQMEADFRVLQKETLERLEQSGQSMAQMQGLMTRADATLEDLTPKIQRMTTDAEQLVLQVRHGVYDFQQTVLPKLRTVTNVAGALRDGFGIFQQLQKSRPQDRR